MKTAIVDIDGTLADCRHRLHHVQAGAKNWKAFFDGIPDDYIIEPVKRVVVALAREYNVVLCSGRPEKYRKATVQWLDEWCVPFDSLYMRPDNDTRPDHIVKMQLLAGIRKDGFEPFVVIDDRTSVVEMWREQGLLCMQVAPVDNNVPDTARLTLMVGPSGCGKTTWLAGACGQPHIGGGIPCIHSSHVISSDQIRHDLSGDFRNQDCNNAVFAALHSVVKARLKAGLPTVVDATNIRTKDRTSLATLMNVPVTYIVINRMMADKRRDGGWRISVMFKDGSDLIERHEEIFNASLAAILSGDGLPNVTVVDLRQTPQELKEAA